MSKKLFALCAVSAMLCGLSGCASDPPQAVQPRTYTSVEQTPAPTPVPTTTPTPTSAPTPAPTPEGMVALAEGFTGEPVPEDVRARMLGKSYPENCPVPWEDLRYLRVLHTGFDGQIKEGEMVVGVRIETDVLEIFKALCDAAYPIERMALIDEYDAVDEASMADNNTSAFCYRTVKGTDTLSYHARGLAVDVNPLYNPYVKPGSVEPEAGAPYADRTQDNPYFIARDDLCYRLFTERGFIWGGDWKSGQDYQHFAMED